MIGAAFGTVLAFAMAVRGPWPPKIIVLPNVLKPVLIEKTGRHPSGRRPVVLEFIDFGRDYAAFRRRQS